MYTFDFRKTAERLRTMIVEAQRGRAKELTRAALLEVETEQVVQCVLYLYDHLVRHEQWVRAAHLLSWALPSVAERDPRICEAVGASADVAKALATPELERGLWRKSKPYVIPDEAYGKTFNGMTVRSHYWSKVLHIAQARRVLEYGCGCGAHLIGIGRLETGVTWCGVDVNPDQVVECSAQAERLGAKNVEFRTDPAPEWYGTFGCVGVLDVLEHSPSPEAVLTEAEKYLRPGGAMVVSCPDGPWALHDPVPKDLRGAHVNVTSLDRLVDMALSRGVLLDGERIPEHAGEGNASACVAYVPGEKETDK